MLFVSKGICNINNNYYQSLVRFTKKMMIMKLFLQSLKCVKKFKQNILLVQNFVLTVLGHFAYYFQLENVNFPISETSKSISAKFFWSYKIIHFLPTLCNFLNVCNCRLLRKNIFLLNSPKLISKFISNKIIESCTVTPKIESDQQQKKSLKINEKKRPWNSHRYQINHL